MFTIVLGSLADQRSRQYLKVATQRLGAVFPRVRAYRDSPLSEPGATNVVFFASDGGLDDEIGINHDERAAAAELSGAEPGSEDWVAAMHKSWEVARCDAGTCALLANVSDTFAQSSRGGAATGYSAWRTSGAFPLFREPQPPWGRRHGSWAVHGRCPTWTRAAVAVFRRRRATRGGERPHRRRAISPARAAMAWEKLSTATLGPGTTSPEGQKTVRRVLELSVIKLLPQLTQINQTVAVRIQTATS